MFAIAAYSISEKILWLARDKFGEKPLYYNYDSAYGFSFASELRAFSYFPNFKRQICQKALAQYLRYGYVPEPLSIYKKTYKLEPGHIIKFDKKNQVLKKQYWDCIVSFTEAKHKKFHGTFEEAKEEVKKKLITLSETD